MKILGLLSFVISFLPFLLGVVHFSKLEKELKFFVYFLAVICLFGISEFLMSHFNRSNSIIYHLYTFIEYYFVSYLYYRLFSRQSFKTLVIILSIVFFISGIVSKFLMESLNRLDNVTMTFESVFILIITSMYVVEYLMSNLYVNYRDFRFSLTIVFMMYFGGSLIIFVLSNVFPSGWYLHNILNILKYISFVLVILWNRRLISSGG